MSKHLATFFLDEDDDKLELLGTRQVSISIWPTDKPGEHYAIFPSYIVPGQVMFDPNHWLAKQYGLDKPLLVLDYFPTYDELAAFFDGKTILPIMPEWEQYAKYKK